MCKVFLHWLNNLVCKVLGLEDQQQSQLEFVEIRDNKIYITNTNPYKRHLHRDEWRAFEQITLPLISPEEKEKLGAALGKVLANDLVITFEESHIHLSKELA